MEKSYNCTFSIESVPVRISGVKLIYCIYRMASFKKDDKNENCKKIKFHAYILTKNYYTIISRRKKFYFSCFADTIFFIVIVKI